MPFTPPFYWRAMQRMQTAERRGDIAEVKAWLDIAERSLRLADKRSGLFREVQNHEAKLTERRLRIDAMKTQARTPRR